MTLTCNLDPSIARSGHRVEHEEVTHANRGGFLCLGDMFPPNIPPAPVPTPQAHNP